MLKSFLFGAAVSSTCETNTVPYKLNIDIRLSGHVSSQETNTNETTSTKSVLPTTKPLTTNEYPTATQVPTITRTVTTQPPTTTRTVTTEPSTTTLTTKPSTTTTTVTTEPSATITTTTETRTLSTSVITCSDEFDSSSITSTIVAFVPPHLPDLACYSSIDGYVLTPQDFRAYPLHFEDDIWTITDCIDLMIHRFEDHSDMIFHDGNQCIFFRLVAPITSADELFCSAVPEYPEGDEEIVQYSYCYYVADGSLPTIDDCFDLDFDGF